MWIPLLWKYSRAGWMGIGATWSGEMCSWQGGWNSMIFKIPSNTNYSMVSVGCSHTHRDVHFSEQEISYDAFLSHFAVGSEHQRWEGTQVTDSHRKKKNEGDLAAWFGCRQPVLLFAESPPVMKAVIHPQFPGWPHGGAAGPALAPGASLSRQRPRPAGGSFRPPITPEPEGSAPKPFVPRMNNARTYWKVGIAFQSEMTRAGM